MSERVVLTTEQDGNDEVRPTDVSSASKEGASVSIMRTKEKEDLPATHLTKR